MNGKTKVVESVKGTSQLIRPQYSEGLLLHDDDLTAGVDYTRGLSRLLFRTLFGCGVLCGLTISAKENCGKLCITVLEGIALDCLGDPVQVPSPQSIPVDLTCGEPINDSLWVLLRRIDKHCAPRTTVCSPEDDDQASVCTRVRDGFEIRVVIELPPCVCGCIEERGQSAREDANIQANPRRRRATTDKSGDSHDCLCADPKLKCYDKHYNDPGCSGSCSPDCNCEWILLARIEKVATKEDNHYEWQSDHKVRRFVRPVLMRDPQAAIDEHPNSSRT